MKETHSYVWDDGANVTPAEGPILLLMHRQVELHIHSQPRIRSEDPVRYSLDPDRTLKSMLRRFRGSKIEGGLNPKRSFWKSPKSLIDLRTLPLPSIVFRTKPLLKKKKKEKVVRSSQMCTFTLLLCVTHTLCCVSLTHSLLNLNLFAMTRMCCCPLLSHI